MRNSQNDKWIFRDLTTMYTVPNSYIADRQFFFSWIPYRMNVNMSYRKKKKCKIN